MQKEEKYYVATWNFFQHKTISSFRKKENLHFVPSSSPKTPRKEKSCVLNLIMLLKVSFASISRSPFQVPTWLSCHVVSPRVQHFALIFLLCLIFLMTIKFWVSQNLSFCSELVEWNCIFIKNDCVWGIIHSNNLLLSLIYGQIVTYFRVVHFDRRNLAFYF